MALMLMDKDFNLLAELPGYESLQLTRSYYGMGAFEVRMHPKSSGAEQLDPGRVLFFSEATHKAMVIEKIVWKSGQVSASGKTLKGLAARKICVPPALDDGHFGWDRFTGSAEAAYHHYAAANLYAPEDASRKVARLVGGDNANRGIVLPWQSRFGNLETLLSDIGETTEMGWDIVPDFSAKQYIFTAWEGRDLSQGTGRVIMSERNGNANDVTYTLDLTTAKTTAYVGGAGEDENRLIRCHGYEATGWDRRECWVDAGSISDTDMLAVAAESKLDDVEPKESLAAEIIDTGLCRYERDYDVGDKVLLAGAGRMAAVRLLEMRESYDGSGRKLQATFGAAPVTILDYLRGSQGAVR